MSKLFCFYKMHSRILWWKLVDDSRNFCMREETEKVYRKLEEVIGIC